MKKKIVFIFRTMDIGGAQKIEAFVANCASKVWEVVCINMSAKPCRIAINNEIPVVVLPYDGIEKEKNPLLKFLKKVCFLLRLRRLILTQKPDMVCAFLSDVVRITDFALRGTCIPIIGSERGDPTVLSQKQQNKYKKSYLRCKGVVFQLPKVQDFYRLPPTVFQTVIPNPFLLRQHKAFLPKEKLILAAGRLEKQKRFDVLLHSFYLFYQKHTDYRLLLYGEGSLKNELMQLVKDKKMEDAVTFAGNTDDVFSQAQTAEMFILSSDYEGIPNVLIEAMECGIPCIATDCSPGGVRFLLENGKNGIIVPRNQPEKMAEAMDFLINHSQKKQEYIDNAQKSILRFSPQNIEKQWIDFLNAILEK